MSDVTSMPPGVFLEEKNSQKDRVISEVISKLWALNPTKDECKKKQPCFTLESGHKCWIKRFSEPRFDDGEPRYYFDVVIEDGHALDHIEFRVECSGFGGFVQK